MDTTYLQAMARATQRTANEVIQIMEQSMRHYPQDKRTAQAVIQHLPPDFPRELARRLLLTMTNLNMIDFFVEHHVMTEAQGTEMREHLRTLAETYELMAAPEANGKRGEHPADVPEDQADNEVLGQCSVEALYELALSCVAQYRAGTTAMEATRHIRPEWKCGAVRRLLLSLMNLQMLQILAAPGGITPAQYDELAEHLLIMETTYEDHLAPNGYPLEGPI